MFSQAKDYKKTIASQMDLNWDGDPSIDNDEEEENKILKELETSKYIYVPNILSGHLCEQLSYHLFKLKQEEKLKPDKQCPLSYTVYGDSIKMGSNENIFIEKGDGVLYKGCQIEHWRTPYQGKWQSQVFFHFVDAKGAFKEYIFDKRKSLTTEVF